MNPDDLTPHEGVPRRIVAGPGLTPKERRRREKHHAQVEKWKAEAIAGSMSRGDRIRTVLSAGCLALILACLYVPSISLADEGFRMVKVWLWVWESSLGVDAVRLAIQVAIVLAVTGLAVVVASREPVD